MRSRRVRRGSPGAHGRRAGVCPAAAASAYPAAVPRPGSDRDVPAHLRQPGRGHGGPAAAVVGQDDQGAPDRGVPVGLLDELAAGRGPEPGPVPVLVLLRRADIEPVDGPRPRPSGERSSPSSSRRTPARSATAQAAASAWRAVSGGDVRCPAGLAVVEVKPGQGPPDGAVAQRDDPVGQPGVDQRLRADDATGSARRSSPPPWWPDRAQARGPAAPARPRARWWRSGWTSSRTRRTGGHRRTTTGDGRPSSAATSPAGSDGVPAVSATSSPNALLGALTSSNSSPPSAVQPARPPSKQRHVGVPEFAQPAAAAVASPPRSPSCPSSPYTTIGHRAPRQSLGRLRLELPKRERRREQRMARREAALLAHVEERDLGPGPQRGADRGGRDGRKNRHS